MHFLFFTFVYFFRHIGHVGWDPNTGFDVSVFASHKHYCSKLVGIPWPGCRFLLLFIFMNSGIYLNAVFMYIYYWGLKPKYSFVIYGYVSKDKGFVLLGFTYCNVKFLCVDSKIRKVFLLADHFWGVYTKLLESTIINFWIIQLNYLGLFILFFFVISSLFNL